MAVNNLDNIVGGIGVFGGVQLDNFASVVGIEDFFFHHPLANGCHLRTAFGVYDCCNDVAAECGTDLI